jgi:osmoprotectant transport system permease protein
MIRVVIWTLILLVVAFVPLSHRQSTVRVGSKKFTESVVLGECLRLLIQDANESATHYRELGGTKLVFEALANGEIDVYPEYTGTIREEILSDESAETLEDIRAAFERRGVAMSEPLGFNNTYALAMLRPRAEELGVTKISDLVRHPDLAFGFSNEFMDRKDGWPELQRHYDLSPKSAVGLDHDLAYRQLRLGAIDVIDVYSTDAKIRVHDLVVLKDDRSYFPRYEAVLLYRTDLADRFPKVVASISRLSGEIDESAMTRLNAQVEVNRLSESQVAAEFIADSFDIENNVERTSVASRIVQRTLEHLELVRRSLLPAILLAIPLGIIAAKVPRLDSLVLGIVGIIQTIPSLALLVILMPVMAYFGLSSIGLGSATAITALLLYSLLPIVRNTHAGLRSIAIEHQEAALALGLPATFRLLNIELPLAKASILAGIKTAAVMNVGFATLGALIGAGGYGQPIITGIRLNDTSMILEGAIPAAVLALLVQFAFDLLQRKADRPRGASES